MAFPAGVGRGIRQHAAPLLRRVPWNGGHATIIASSSRSPASDYQCWVSGRTTDDTQARGKRLFRMAFFRICWSPVRKSSNKSMMGCGLVVIVSSSALSLGPRSGLL